MFNKSTDLKNSSAAAKRTASALRTLAGAAELSIADKGVLLTAASIVATIAARKANESKAAKAKEDKYDRDRKAALDKIKPVIDALPCQTIGEKMAIVSVQPHYLDYLTKELQKGTSADLKWALDYWTVQSRTDTAAHLAWCVATGKTSIEQAISELQRKHQDARADARVFTLAKRYVDALQPTEQAGT